MWSTLGIAKCVYVSLSVTQNSNGKNKVRPTSKLVPAAGVRRQQQH